MHPDVLVWSQQQGYSTELLGLTKLVLATVLGKNYFYFSFSSVFRFKQGWEFAHRFSEQIACFFSRKNERPEQIAHSCSFLVSHLRDLLSSLIKKEVKSKSLGFLKLTKNIQKVYQKICFSQIFGANCLLFIS